MILSLPISYERQMILDSNDLQQEHVHQAKGKINPTLCNSDFEGMALLLCMKTRYDAIEYPVVYDVEATRHQQCKLCKLVDKRPSNSGVPRLFINQARYYFEWLDLLLLHTTPCSLI